LTARRQVVVTRRSEICANGWDFMAKLIIIFAGAPGKARGSNSDDGL
jgi:hypothetical protein